MTPGKPELINISLWGSSIVFEKGHRIGIHITSSNFPRFEVNPNTGENQEVPRIAHNTIYHNKAYPSALILPVLNTP